MTTGEKITLLRKEKNITQEQLAEILNVSRQSYGNRQAKKHIFRTDQQCAGSNRRLQSPYTKMDPNQREGHTGNFYSYYGRYDEYPGMISILPVNICHYFNSDIFPSHFLIVASLHEWYPIQYSCPRRNIREQFYFAYHKVVSME